MKLFILSLFVISLILFRSEEGIAGVAGDVDNDGRVGVSEAVYALQVASQLKTELPELTSVVWKAAWKPDEEYQKYDAVEYGGSVYVCIENHASGNPNDLKLSSLWQPLASSERKCNTSPCASPEQISAMINRALSQLNGNDETTDDDIIAESDKLAVSALKNAFMIAMTYFREQGKPSLTSADLHDNGYVAVDGVAMTIRSGSYDSLLLTASHANSGKTYAVDQHGTITPKETFSDLASGQLKIFISQVRQWANQMAQFQLKNAYTASQAYFCDFPSEAVDMAKLKMAGYRDSQGVTLVVEQGDFKTLTIKSSHMLGTLTYRMGRHGISYEPRK